MEHAKHAEDQEHLLGKCPAWKQGRRETFGKTFLSHMELIPPISSLSWGGLAGFRPMTVRSRRGNSTTTTTNCMRLTATLSLLTYCWLLGATGLELSGEGG